MRVYLIELLAVTAVFAFGLGTLLHASPLSECLFYSFTLLLLLAAVLCAAGRRGEARYFWIGFAIAGCSYLAYAQLPDDDAMAPRCDGPAITTQLLRVAFNLLHSGEESTVFSPQAARGFFSVPPEAVMEEGDGDAGNAAPRGHAPIFEPTSTLRLATGGGQSLFPDDLLRFMRSGHSMWALLLGWLGGHFTCFVRRRGT